MSGSMLFVQSRQAGGCHPVPRERHPLNAGTKVSGPQGLPISILVCVFNWPEWEGQEPTAPCILRPGSVTVTATNAALTYAQCLYIHVNE